MLFKMRLASTIFFFLLLSGNANASTVLQVDVDYLVSEAGFIFEGEVLSHSAEWNEAQTAIFTEIEFRIDDVLKGGHNKSTITLRFAGGEVDGQGMRVSSMVYPQVGERGVYFVVDPSRDFVNPLVGWSQGHFRIENDSDGRSRITTESRSPVLGLEPAIASDAGAAAVQRGDHIGDAHSDEASAIHDRDQQYAPFSEGVAKGVGVGENTMDRRKAMGKDAFKQAIRSKLDVLKK